MHKIKLNNCKLNLVKNTQTEFRVVNKIAENSHIKQLYIIYATVVGYNSLSLSWSSLHVCCHYPSQDSTCIVVVFLTTVKQRQNFGFFKTK